MLIIQENIIFRFRCDIRHWWKVCRQILLCMLLYSFLISSAIRASRPQRNSRILYIPLSPLAAQVSRPQRTSRILYIPLSPLAIQGSRPQRTSRILYIPLSPLAAQVSRPQRTSRILYIPLSPLVIQGMDPRKPQGFSTYLCLLWQYKAWTPENLKDSLHTFVSSGNTRLRTPGNTFRKGSSCWKVCRPCLSSSSPSNVF